MPAQPIKRLLLHDLIHKEVKVYVDNMIVKAMTRAEHVEANKCIFEETSEKLLGLLVNHRGIEIDPAKIKAFQEMPSPRTEKEIRGFLGKVQYLSRFITQLTSTYEPIFKLLKKNSSKQSNHECQEAFEKIKDCLLSLPALTLAVAG
ncbi:putative mitochondrial protein AtMg00860 [Tasmannia lanceolata]|uniref:putative mitochondrial protein AtMg00860 n=1 Tax=Tasmannia lanceolata TaxID=3420 RepID=UPI00406389AF